MLHYNSHGADKPVVEGIVPPDLEPTPRCEMRDVPDEAYFDGRVVASAVETLGELSRRNDPWFLAIGFWKPYADFNAPKKYWDMYDRAQIDMPANPGPPKTLSQIALHDSRDILRAFQGRPRTRLGRYGMGTMPPPATSMRRSER